MEVYSLLAFCIGAIFGSFFNVVIKRAPLGEDIIFLKSHCPHCKKNIKWFHNIPLISYILLKGQCAYCQKKISFVYFAVELLSATLTLLLFIKLGWSIDFILACVLFYLLLVLAFIDLEYKAVPDYLLLLALIWVFVVMHENIFEALKHAILFAGFFALLEFVVTFYIQNIKSRLTKDESLKVARSLGEGDIPIVAIIGALLGIKAGIVAVFLAAFFAIIPSIYANIKKRDPQTPFIPYLLLGLVVEYLFEISKVIR